MHIVINSSNNREHNELTKGTLLWLTHPPFPSPEVKSVNYFLSVLVWDHA